MSSARAALGGHTCRAIVVCLALLIANGCGLAGRPMSLMADGGARAACRQPITSVVGAAAAPPISWTAPAHPPDRERLDAWCAATAAPVILPAAAAHAALAMDVFARPPAGWAAQASRLDDRHGSDHCPLLARFVPSPTMVPADGTIRHGGR